MTNHQIIWQEYFIGEKFLVTSLLTKISNFLELNEGENNASG